jgi:hypothetical protein
MHHVSSNALCNFIDPLLAVKLRGVIAIVVAICGRAIVDPVQHHTYLLS